MKQLFVALCLVVGVFSAQAQTIAEQAMATADLSTFVTACKAADLDATLAGEGPYTVFAPSNDAFAALPDGTLESLLLPENKDQLVAILTYHIVPGAMISDEVAEGRSPSLQGEELDITSADGMVRVNGASVTTADIEASNGVIHVIDAIIMPPSQLKN